MSGPVEEYEVLFRATGNALFALEALECCQRDAPLPSWVFSYLMGATRSMAALGQPAWDDVPPDRIESRHMGVLDLADAVCAGTMSADKAMAAVPRALGLQRGSNYNAMADLALARQGFREAWHVDVTRAGVKDGAALADIEAYYGEARGAGERQIKRRVARARRLWRSQKHKGRHLPG